jgi:phytoene dehydrogenase-like protein
MTRIRMPADDVGLSQGHDGRDMIDAAAALADDRVLRTAAHRRSSVWRMADALVVGSGPNGLAAAIELARAGLRVRVLEAEPTVGGGCRSAELTLPGFSHDICSAVHPLALASPFFRSLPLEQHGLEWVQPPAALAHPFDDGTAALLLRSIDDTVATLGDDGARYRRLMTPLVDRHDELVEALLAPLTPSRMVALARLGIRSSLPANAVARACFRGPRARALFAGLAAHSMLPLTRMPSAAFGWFLGLLGHGVGWPIARGGSQQIAGAMASYLRSLGGELETDRRVDSLRELEGTARLVVLDVTPRQLVALSGDRLPSGYRRKLERYRYGPGVFKIDWALERPIPWRAEECGRAATVHLGATLAEITASEREPWRGGVAERPFVLLVQPTLFDSMRAPAGAHTAWAYCHVPNASGIDMTERIEAQVERFAPGFRDCILARSTMAPAELEAHNANYVGGDINAGAATMRQSLARPVAGPSPYSVPLPGVFLCSASTPPGGGVHGMCGRHAARAALVSHSRVGAGRAR